MQLIKKAEDFARFSHSKLVDMTEVTDMSKSIIGYGKYKLW